MKIVKKIAKWLGITLLVLIALLILVPIIFKDEIKEMVIDEANKSLNATLSLDDFDLTFISTFPNMTAELKGTKLMGQDEFEGVELLNVNSIKAHVGFWSVVGGDKIEIEGIHIDGLNADVRVLENGLANYDIVKSEEELAEENIEEEESSFELSLKEYSILNTNVNYSDIPGNTFAIVKNLNHTGNGDLDAATVDFKTETTIDALSCSLDNIDYLSEVKTKAILNLLMENSDSESKFTLKENSLQLNELVLSLDGFYQMLEDKDVMDLKLDASKTSFKSLLSLIPAFYHSGYEKMVTSGNLAMNGRVNGDLYDDVLPAWDFGVEVDKASINYPDLPGKISNVALKASSSFPGGSDLNKMEIDVNKFHANLSKNTLDATLSLRNIEKDPFINATALANLDLSTIKNFIPSEDQTSYEGKIIADVKLKGSMSALDNEDYEKFDAAGTLQMDKIKYSDPTLPDIVEISKVLFTFSPQNLSLNELDAKMGESDFNMNGAIDNYLGYALRDEDLKGNFAFNSENLNLDKLIPESEEAENTSSPEDETTAVNSNDSDALLVPSNIDFDLNTSIKNMTYNGMQIKDIQGHLFVRDEIAKLSHIKMNTMDGAIELNGDYNTQLHSKPKINLTYDLKHININELSKNFNTVEKLAPITKYAHGHISSKFKMKSDLEPSLDPIYETIDADGDISSENLNIKDHKTLTKIGDLTKIKEISNPTLKSFFTKFTVKDGKISVNPPFDLKTGKINSKVSGYTTLDQKIDYSMDMLVPKSEIPSGMIDEIEKAMSSVNNLSPHINMGGLPDEIPVKVKIVGDVNNPKITTDFKEALKKATGEFKDNVIENIKETVKDTLNAIKDEAIDTAKEEIEKQKQKILNDAEKQVDQLKLEAKKQGDELIKEAEKQGDDLIKQAGGNPLKKVAAKESAKQLKKQAEKQAININNKADVEGDKIMAKAREKANNLGK